MPFDRVSFKVDDFLKQTRMKARVEAKKSIEALRKSMTDKKAALVPDIDIPFHGASPHKMSMTTSALPRSI